MNFKDKSKFESLFKIAGSLFISERLVCRHGFTLEHVIILRTCELVSSIVCWNRVSTMTSFIDASRLQTSIIPLAVSSPKHHGFCSFLFQSLDIINILLVEILSMSDYKHEIPQAEESLSGGLEFSLSACV